MLRSQTNTEFRAFCLLDDILLSSDGRSLPLPYLRSFSSAFKNSSLLSIPYPKFCPPFLLLERAYPAAGLSIPTCMPRQFCQVWPEQPSPALLVRQSFYIVPPYSMRHSKQNPVHKRLSSHLRTCSPIPATWAHLVMKFH